MNGEQTMDAGLRKLANETEGDRTQLVREMIAADPEVGHTAVTKAAKEKFGVGVDFYTFKNMKKAKVKPKGSNAVGKRNYAKKDKFARRELGKRSMSFAELNELSMKKIGTNIPRGLYDEYHTKSPFKAKVVDRVKADLKKGTTPLKSELKRTEKVLIECGVEEVTMKIIDGVPHWHVTEKRSYDF